MIRKPYTVYITAGNCISRGSSLRSTTNFDTVPDTSVLFIWAGDRHFSASMLMYSVQVPTGQYGTTN